MSDFNWDDLERFEQTGSRISTPYISISRRKTISLSSGFIHHAKEQMNGKTHVVIFYSKYNNCIVFKFTDDENENGAIKVTIKDGSKSNCSIAVKSFLNYYNMDVDSLAGRYTAFISDIPNLGKLWAVCLKNKINRI